MGKCPPNKPWKVTYKDKDGNVIRYECYAEQPSVNGSDPDSKYQINTESKNVPYAKCNCPDSERRIVYTDATGNVYAEKNWGTSNAGAPTIKGVKVCKHVYATLDIKGVVEQFMPNDYVKDPVEEQYNEDGLLGGQDVAWELQPDKLAKDPSGYKQTSKRWY